MTHLSFRELGHVLDGGVRCRRCGVGVRKATAQQARCTPSSTVTPPPDTAAIERQLYQMLRNYAAVGITPARMRVLIRYMEQRR